MSALDSDVIKTYVELGLGVGILARTAFDPTRDRNLRPLDTGTLFKENLTRIAVRRGRFQRGYACRFMEICNPRLEERRIRAEIDRT